MLVSEGRYCETYNCMDASAITLYSETFITQNTVYWNPPGENTMLLMLVSGVGIEKRITLYSE